MPRHGRQKSIRSIEERNKMVEDNHGLVIAFLSRNHLSENDIFDYYGAACEGLIDACDLYDESAGFTLSTFAYVCMDRRVTRELVKYRRKMEIPSEAKVSIDKPISSIVQSSGDVSKTVEELIADASMPIDDIIFSVDLAKIYHKYTDRERDIICDRISGFSFNHIGEKWSISKQRAQQIFERFKNDVAMYEGMCKNEA